VTASASAPTLGQEITGLLRAQSRAAEELPHQLFGPRRPLLSTVHVHQRLARDQAAWEGARSDRRTLQAGFGRVTTCSLEDALALHRHLVLIGGPGQGKSTVTLHLAGRLARAWLDWEQPADRGTDEARGLPPALPLRVTARQLATTSPLPWPQALAQAAAAELGQHLDHAPAPHLLEASVAGVPWLLLVDGLDEISDAGTREALLAVLAARMDQPDSPHRILVTSRPLPAAELSRLHRTTDGVDVGQYELAAFDTAALEAFIGRWFSTGSSPHGEAQAQRFLTQVRQAGLLDVVRIPLLAAIAAVLFESDQDNLLPRRRHELYERYIAHLLAGERAHPGQQRLRDQLAAVAGGSELADWLLTPTQRDSLIEHLAVTQTESDTFLLDAAFAWIQDYGPAVRRYPPNWDSTVETIVTRAGLLLRRGSGIEFVHHSFAEHLAAAQHARQLMR
jgi:predicted NACHT family NTPase